jgi:hypothetical protein
MSTERGKSHLAPPGLEKKKIPEARAGKKTLNFAWEKKLRDLSPSKGFQFVSLKPRNLAFCFKVPEKPLKTPRFNR